MGRDRYLPQWFGAVHPRFRTPFRAIVFLVPVAIAFAILPVLLATVITFSILSGLLMYSFMGTNVIRFRKLWPLGSITRGYVLPLHPIRSLLGQYAGGIFVWAISVMDAYRVATHRAAGVLRGRAL